MAPETDASSLIISRHCSDMGQQADVDDDVDEAKHQQVLTPLGGTLGGAAGVQHHPGEYRVQPLRLTRRTFSDQKLDLTDLRMISLPFITILSIIR